MSQIDEVIPKIERILKNQGYKIISDVLPKEFSWKPHIFAKKKNGFIALLIRESDSIPEVLVQRISSTKPLKNKLYISIIFCKKPRISAVRVIGLYGIGIKYLYDNTISIIRKSKDFSKVRKKVSKKEAKKKKTMLGTNIFVSSHQIIDERKVAEDLIDELRSAYKLPIFPILVEKDTRYTISQKKKCIKRNLYDSHLFLGILAEEYRPNVNGEVREAFKPTCFGAEDILIFVKANKKCKIAWKKLIEWIKKKDTVKYLEYTDIKDFRIRLLGALMLKIRNIHKKLNIPFLE